MSGKGKDKGKAKAKAQASITKHQDELTSLENTDPEFYQFLKQNDTDLLDFGKHDIDALDDDDDEDDENSGMVEVNEELLNAVAEKAKNGSYSALKQLLGIFRAACIPAVDVADGKRASRYSVNTPEAYELSMTKTIEAAHTSFYKILGSAPYSSSTMTREAVQSLVKHAKWKKCEVLILSFFKSMLHSIASLADTRTSQQQSEVLIFLISSLELYVPLLGSMHRLANTVLKTLLGVWSLHNDAAAVASNAPPPAAVAAASEILSSSSGSSKKAKKAAAEKANAALQQVQSTAADAIRAASDARSHAFLRVRQMALLLPGSIAEDCFRSIYLAFTRHCKSYNDQTSGSVNFMVACIVELYRTDTALAYQLAFIYVRQLGLFLRTAINKKTSEAVKQLVNWQFLNCLRLWTAVVSAQPQSNDRGLGELTYPLVQVMVGVMSITPSCVYIPCKFHLIGFMQQLAANCKLFIPTAPKLVEILEIPELQSKPTPSTEVAPKFSSIVRFAGDAVSKVVIRDAVLSEVVKLLRTEVEVYRYHPGLPEYTYLSSRKLRNFVKKCKNPKWKDLVRALIGHVDQLAAEAKKLRTKLSKSPMQIAADGADFEPLLAVAAAASSGPGKGGKHPQDANDAGLLPVDQRMRKMMYGAHTGNATSSVSAPTASSVGTGKASRVSFADLRASSMPMDDDEEDEDEDSEEEDEDDSEEEDEDDEDDSDDEEDEGSEGDSDSDDEEGSEEEEEEAPQPTKRKLTAAAQQQSQQKAKKGKPTPAPAPTAKAGKGRKQQAPRGAAVALSDEQDVVQSMTDGWSDDDN